MDISKDENPIQPRDSYKEKDGGERLNVRAMNLRQNLSSLSYS